MGIKRVWGVALLVSVFLWTAVAVWAEPPPPRSGPPRNEEAEVTAEAGFLGAASTAGPIGGTFVIRNDPGLAEVYPAVAYNRQRQEYLVVWYNDRPDYPDIQAQRLRWDGTPIGGPFYIATGAVQRRYPAVAWDSNHDRYLVVWEQKESSGTGIRGRLVSGAGQVLGESDIAISEMPYVWYGFRPAVAYAYVSDRYLVVWKRSVSGSISSDIAGQVISGAGTLDGDNLVIALGTWDYSHDYPALAYDRRVDEFLVAWERYDKDAHIYDICAQRMTGSGTPLGSPFLIAYYTINSTRPAVAVATGVDPGGQYLVVWELQYAPGDKDIYGRPVTGDGTMLPGFYISWADAIDETSPAVAGTYYSQHYLVTWKRPHNPPFIWEVIRGRSVPASASPLGLEKHVGGVLVGRPAVAEGWPGDFLVVFDDQPLGADRGIYGRLWGSRVYLPLVLK